MKYIDSNKTIESSYERVPLVKRIFFNYMLGFLLFLTIGIVAGCSSDDVEQVAGGGTPTVPTVPTPQQGTAAATGNVTGKAGNAIRAIGKSGTNTAVTNSVLRMLGLPLVPLSSDPTSEAETQFNAALALLFLGAPTVDGSKLTFDPDENMMCDTSADPGAALFVSWYSAFGSAHDLASAITCAIFYSHLQLILDVASLNAGSIDVVYLGNTLSTVDYDDSGGENGNFLRNRLFLNAYRLICLAMIAESFFDINPLVPATLEGVVGFRTDDLGGGDNAKVNFFIEQEINILDTSLGYDVKIPLSANLLGITANGNTGDLAFTTDIAGGDIGFNKQDKAGLNTYPTMIHWEPWTADYALDSLNKNVINGTTDPITVTKDVTSTSALDWDLKLGQYNWTLNGLDNTIKFNAPYSTTFDIADPLKVFTSNGDSGGLAVSKELGTVLQYVTTDLSGNPDPTEQNAFGQRRFQVKEGSVELSGFGTYSDLDHPFWGTKITPGYTGGVSSGPLRDSITFEGEKAGPPNSIVSPIQLTYTF